MLGFVLETEDGGEMNAEDGSLDIYSPSAWYLTFSKEKEKKQGFRVSFSFNVPAWVRGR